MANWQPATSRNIHRRMIVTGKLVLDTPASFSNGESNGTEILILEDTLERRPLLPGASLAGALRHYLLTRQVGFRVADTSTNDDKTIATVLFGESLGENTSRMESRIIAHDALGMEDSRLTRRDGVKIDGITRTADEGMLFSTQVWEAGTVFDLRFELILYQDDSNQLIHAFAAALEALHQGEITLGGRKHRGYGRAHIENWQVSLYDMHKPQDLSLWLLNRPNENIAAQFRDAAKEFTEDNRRLVRIDADYRILDSMLIRASSDFADHEHLNSAGRPVLSGTSVAGALRARALKIANTINPNLSQVLVDDMFGEHGDSDSNTDLSASRLIIEEREIDEAEFQMIQNRVKIDRFTGGAFETALFSERPVFADDNTLVQINMELRYPEDGKNYDKLRAQTGLLLLLIKDLWTQDLALGGESSIGRGRLQGIGAKIHFKNVLHDNDELWVTFDANGIKSDSSAHAPQLETFIDALWQDLGGMS